MKHIFIVNPVSGKGKYKEVVEEIKLYFENPEDYQIIFTQYPGHAKEIAAKIQAPDRIYAVGGDGTAHEVLNGLNPEVSLGIIPVGSGNDFVKMYVTIKELRRLLIKTIEGSVQLVDVGEANGVKFLNCFNVGLDAEVNVQVNNNRKTWIPRNFVYLSAALSQIMKNFSIKLDYIVDGEPLEKDVVLSSIMNGSWYGGGFKSAPDAILDDGYLDMCIVESLPRHKIFPLLPVYKKGNHVDLDVVTLKKVKEVTIKHDEPFTYGCDGETAQAKEVNIKVLEKVLPLITPK